MKYTEDNMLRSASGFAYPFADDDTVSVTLDYGEQTHPVTGETFHHSGLDFDARRRVLYALADGLVISVGSDPVHEVVQVIRYGSYDVTYGHLSNVMANFGERVIAGQPVALSGDLLHFEVRFKGEEINPVEFIAMLYSNIQAMEEVEEFRNSSGSRSAASSEDASRPLLYISEYLHALLDGSYRPSPEMEMSLRNLFALASERRFYYESIPSFGNPAGLGPRAAAASDKMERLILADIERFVSSRYGGVAADGKKKVPAY